MNENLYLYSTSNPLELHTFTLLVSYALLLDRFYHSHFGHQIRGLATSGLRHVSSQPIPNGLCIPLSVCKRELVCTRARVCVVCDVCVCVCAPCAVCGRSLSESGMARHKCKEERRKPIADQIGSRKCPACKRWFRSAGGLAVHKCRPDGDRSIGTVADPPLSAPNSVAAVPVPATTQLTLPYCQAHCSACGRCCRSKRGFQLHSCAKYTRTLVGR